MRKLVVALAVAVAICSFISAGPSKDSVQKTVKAAVESPLQP